MQEEFLPNLPHTPYCTDDYRFGQKPRDKAQAIHRKFIQLNPPSMIHWIILDIDYVGIVERIENELLPPPNFVCINPQSKKAHIMFRLATPVCRGANARTKPQQLLALVTQALVAAFDADPSFTQHLAKNPLHPYWQAQRVREHPWDLTEFWEWISPGPRMRTPNLQESSQGLARHVFDLVRRWAYEEVKRGNPLSLESLQLQAYKAASNHVTQSNIRTYESMARSILKWTTEKYTGRCVPSPLQSEQQRSKAKKAAGRPKKKGVKRGLGVPRWRSSASQRMTAFNMHREGTSLRKIGSALGVSKETVKRWIEDQQLANSSSPERQKQGGELTKPFDNRAWLGSTMRPGNLRLFALAGSLTHKAGSYCFSMASPRAQTHAKKAHVVLGPPVGVQRARSPLAAFPPGNIVRF